MSEQPSRYQRSMSGMIGAIVVTLVAIGAFVAFRALNRDDLEVEPEAVDYVDSVRALQAEGRLVVYPPELPEGWTATSADYRPGQDSSWAVGALTSEGDFAGFREQTEPVEDLVEVYVDEAATEGGAVSLDSSIAGSWRSFTDEEGDYALAAESEGTTVLVYGSAGEEEVRALAELLTRDPLSAPTEPTQAPQSS